MGGLQAQQLVLSLVRSADGALRVAADLHQLDQRVGTQALVVVERVLDDLQLQQLVEHVFRVVFSFAAGAEMFRQRAQPFGSRDVVPAQPSVEQAGVCNFLGHRADATDKRCNGVCGLRALAAPLRGGDEREHLGKMLGLQPRQQVAGRPGGVGVGAGAERLQQPIGVGVPDGDFLLANVGQLFDERIRFGPGLR